MQLTWIIEDGAKAGLPTADQGYTGSMSLIIESQGATDSISARKTSWAVAGFKDTLLRCLMKPEVLDGATQEVFQGVQA
jgi:hypothetical protein